MTSSQEDRTEGRQRARWNPDGLPEIVHECPPRGSGVMPCCGRVPVEVPLYHRLTLDPGLVTCTGSEPEVQGA